LFCFLIIFAFETHEFAQGKLKRNNYCAKSRLLKQLLTGDICLFDLNSTRYDANSNNNAEVLYSACIMEQRLYLLQMKYYGLQESIQVFGMANAADF